MAGVGLSVSSDARRKGTDVTPWLFAWQAFLRGRREAFSTSCMRKLSDEKGLDQLRLVRSLVNS